MFASIRAWLDTLGLVGLGSFDVTETHIRSVFSSILAKNGGMIRPAGLEAPRCYAQEDDVESHQRHARIRQRIDGHDSQ